jgi:hypothetical protein
MSYSNSEQAGLAILIAALVAGCTGTSSSSGMTGGSANVIIEGGSSAMGG